MLGIGLLDHLNGESSAAQERQGRPKSLELCATVVLAGYLPKATNFLFKIKRQLFARSERVKGIDFHPVEPWILTTLYSGMHPGAWNLECC